MVRGVELADELSGVDNMTMVDRTPVRSPHDLVMWDNRCVNHRREGWPSHLRRTMHRSQTGAARPF